MFETTSRIRDSIFGMFNARVEPAKPAANTAQIRERMLNELLGVQRGDAVRLACQIQLAQDAESLWYRRVDLMQTLCRARGEVRARQVLEDITPLFQGLVPQAMTAGTSACGLRYAR